jgi:hypothetical protein
VIECLPTERLDVVNVALPPLSGVEPSGAPLSLKVTVPVGVPAPGATVATVAVKATAWPDDDGFTEDVTVVVVDAWFTTWLSVEEVLVLKFVLPT